MRRKALPVFSAAPQMLKNLGLVALSAANR
jgi:hypothetical protein